MTGKDIELNLKYKLIIEDFEKNGDGIMPFKDILDDIRKIKVDNLGRVNPKTVTSRANAAMLANILEHYSAPLFRPKLKSEYKSLLQKNTCFDQFNITSRKKFDEIYDEIKEYKTMIFRGQREAKWRLYNSLQREWLDEKLYDSNITYQNLVENIVRIGETDFGEEIAKTNKVNPISILGYLQHHKCPTPLIDWTYKFEHALYFAMDGLKTENRKIDIENYFSVYYIEEENLDGGDLRTIINNSLISLDQEFVEKMAVKMTNDLDQRLKIIEHYKGKRLITEKDAMENGLISFMTRLENLFSGSIIYFTDTTFVKSEIEFAINNNQNILNQSGVLMWNSNQFKPIELIGQEQNNSEIKGEDSKPYFFCGCFNIHKRLESHIRKRLEKDGISEAQIYPSKIEFGRNVFERARTNGI